MQRTDSTPEPNSSAHRDDVPGIPTLPRPNVVLAEPATVQACAADYEANAHVRADFNKQQAAR